MNISSQAAAKPRLLSVTPIFTHLYACENGVRT